MFSTTISLLCIAATALSASVNPLDIHPMTSQEARESFSAPPAVFSSAPLWVWNDMMSKEQIAKTLRCYPVSMS